MLCLVIISLCVSFAFTNGDGANTQNWYEAQGFLDHDNVHSMAPVSIGPNGDALDMKKRGHPGDGANIQNWYESQGFLDHDNADLMPAAALPRLGRSVFEYTNRGPNGVALDMKKRGHPGDGANTRNWYEAQGFLDHDNADLMKAVSMLRMGRSVSEYMNRGPNGDALDMKKRGHPGDGANTPNRFARFLYPQPLNQAAPFIGPISDALDMKKRGHPGEVPRHDSPPL